MDPPPPPFPSPSPPPEEEEHIPRPPNSYMLYRVDGLTPLQVQFEKEHQKRLSMTDASKILGPRWANESAEVRQEYERRAKVVRAEHDKKYPNYVFKPVKKKTKEEKAAERKRKKALVQHQKQLKKVLGSSQDPRQLVATSNTMPYAASVVQGVAMQAYPQMFTFGLPPVPNVSNSSRTLSSNASTPSATFDVPSSPAETPSPPEHPQPQTGKRKRASRNSNIQSRKKRVVSETANSRPSTSQMGDSRRVVSEPVPTVGVMSSEVSQPAAVVLQEPQVIVAVPLPNLEVSIPAQETAELPHAAVDLCVASDSFYEGRQDVYEFSFQYPPADPPFVGPDTLPTATAGASSSSALPPLGQDKEDYSWLYDEWINPEAVSSVEPLTQERESTPVNVTRSDYSTLTGWDQLPSSQSSNTQIPTQYTSTTPAAPLTVAAPTAPPYAQQFVPRNPPYHNPYADYGSVTDYINAGAHTYNYADAYHASFATDTSLPSASNDGGFQPHVRGINSYFHGYPPVD